MAKLWIFPGSFDPATRGHEDLIRRAAQLCDQLVVAVLVNPDKKGFLPQKKRVELLERMCRDLPNVTVETHNGLLAEFARMKGASAVVRGVRRLCGARVAARDLRGGAALAIAGLAAEGETLIEHAELIDRGYERLEEMLSALGADAIRMDTGA